MAPKFATVEEYVAAQPAEIQLVLEQLRRTLRGVVPEMGERISYQMPTATTSGHDLVYFAAWKRHIGMYPVPAGDAALDRDLEPYRAGASTVRFPYSAPIPYELIGRMVALLVAQRQ